MRQATASLKADIVSGKVNKTMFTEQQLLAIHAEKAQIPGYSWHHHQEIGRMQLVPRDIHSATRHVGGDHLWR
jgi:hypothetical protein